MYFEPTNCMCHEKCVYPSLYEEDECDSTDDPLAFIVIQCIYSVDGVGLQK